MRLTRVYWLLLLAVVPLVLGLVRLRFDVEILNLLPADLPVARGLLIYQEHFAAARELVVTLEAESAEDAEAAARSLAQTLRAQTNLVSMVTWQPVWQESPAQAAELVAYLWLNQPPTVFGELTNRFALTNLAPVLAEARRRLATSFSFSEIGLRGYDPYGLMRLPESAADPALSSETGERLFASRDGTFRLLFVEARPDLGDYRACRRWVSAIERVLAETRESGRLPAPVRLGFTGRPAFVTEVAGGMENDMAGPAGGTLAIIGILFWLTHRRVRPLLWLLFSLILILAGTTALGGLFLGTVNVVSLGFAAILLGLAEDFGILIYQESRSHPGLGPAALRREVAPGIIWSALTTAGAFLILNLSTLPGLGQLGSLVGIGICLAAAGMLYGYLPAVLRLREPADSGEGIADQSRERFLLFAPGRPFPAWVVWGASGFLLLGSAVLLWHNGLRFDHSPNVLKPKHSQANATLEQIRTRLERPREPLWVLIPGRDESEVRLRMAELDRLLREAVSGGLIGGFTLPTALWPQPEHQSANREALRLLLDRREALRQEAMQAGFTADSLVLTGCILDGWQRALAGPGVFWPTNQTSSWVLGKVAARLPEGFLALGLIHPTANTGAVKRLAAEWPASLRAQGIILTAWELLGATVFDTVVRELPRVLVPVLFLVLLVLWLAFRSVKQVVLSLATLGFSGLLLGAAMPLLRWDWNLLNLMALPLLLGLGVDFSIHIQLALRRHGGDRRAVRGSVGRALLLAGTTTVAGFGSLAFSTNGGMASLGRVCALGITLALVTAVYLLPVWWRAGAHRQPATDNSASG